MFSQSILSTDKKGTTLNWWEYWIGHCWMTGWQSISDAFRIWYDFMTDNYEGYALLKEDDDAEECREWFWVSLGEDNTYPKEFLEHLLQMSEDVRTGKEKVYPLDEDFFDRMKKLTDEIDVDFDEELNDDDNF